MRGGPDLLGHEVQERIHATDRSTLYRARRRVDGQSVLVKVSGPGVLPREAFVRYRRERELLDGLTCVGTVRVVDLSVGADFAALVVEDIGGKTVKELIRGGPMALADALAFGGNVARALDGVHAAGIIHRDLNAWNVLCVPATHEVSLIDFELATRWRMEGAPAPVTGRLPYLAPEQIGRVNRRVDSRADLYALGVLLCELMTGHLPADAEDARALIRHHLGGEPTVLVDIVGKLLATAPERRYQTAAAVAADLAQCAQRLAAGGSVSLAIEPFAIAANDVSPRFDFPGKLYGREAELAALGRAFERAAGGSAGVVLVSGYSGIGKTSIVRELRGPVLERGGFFAYAKLDPLVGEGGHAALMSALGDVVAEVVTQGDEAVASWREKILEAVGRDGPALVEVLPSIERIIGPQPALVALEPAAALTRSRQALQKLVLVFARPEHPLVLFVDDLQWADGVTLGLVRLLATGAAAAPMGALLIVGAYRDNEVGGAHQLLSAVAELDRHDGLVHRVEVRPLAEPAVVELLADMFHRLGDDVAELAGIVLRKSGGNPFFMRQLLCALHAAESIRFDEPTRRFVFDIGSIHDFAVTDNVAGVLTENLERLPVTTQRILSLAAAVGSRFELEILATIADLPLERVHDELQVAISEGLVLPLSDLEFFDDAAGQSWLMCRWFGFQHDRIHEAAYGQLARSERERLHVAIGRLLLERAAPAELDEHIFDIIHHLHRGLPLIGEPGERARVADLALRAGRRARDAGVCEVAVASFRCAVRLRDWSEDYDVAFAAHHGLAESLRLGLDFAGALKVLETALAHARTKRDRVTASALEIDLLFHKGESRKAVDCFLAAARIVRADLAIEPAALQVETDGALAVVFSAIDEAPIESLLDLPPMSDPDALALMTLAMSCLTAASQVEPRIWAWLVTTMVSLSLRHGNCAASARGYVAFAMLLHGRGREDDAIRFGKVGFELARRTANRAVRASVAHLYAVLTVPWIEPIDRCLEELAAARSDGLEAGIYSHMGYSAALIASLGLWKGAPLAELHAETERDHKLVLELGEPGNAAMIAASLDLIQAYTTELVEPMPRAERIVIDEENVLQRIYVDLAEVERHYMLGDASRALAVADRSSALLTALPGLFTGATLRFFHCLAVTAVWSAADRDARERMLADYQAAMKRWADRCPANFSAMYLLVEAERARVGGTPMIALDLYDEAIAAATEHGLVKLAALGNELAARFWLERRKRDLSRVYAIKAARLYSKWGARRKVQLLVREELRRSGPVQSSTQ